MRSVAFISAAGWKRSGGERGLVDCPEPFLPLGDGTTPLYRTAKTLSGLGFEVYIGMAPVGYEFSRHWDLFTRDDPLEGSPWTQAREDYASQLGTVVHIPDPGRSGSNDTFCTMLEMVPDWDRVLLARGDLLLAKGDLERIVEALPWPSQYQMAAHHAFYLLDRPAAETYLEQMRPWRHREWETRKAWANAINHWVPDGYPDGCGQFAESGVPVFGSHNGPRVTWIDIDDPQTYEQVLGLVADGTLSWKCAEMEDTPEIVVVMTTWAGPPELNIAQDRLAYARKTVESIKKHFVYPNYTWHIADDASPEWYQDEVRKILDGETFTFSDTGKGWDVNNNINTGLRAAFARADIAVVWPDDRFLEKDVEIEPCVRVLTEYDDVCAVRLTGATVGLRGDPIARCGAEWRLLQKRGTALVYLCFCYLVHKRWVDHYGELPTDLWPVNVAERHTDAAFRRTPGPGILVPEALWNGYIPWGGKSTWEKPHGGAFRDTPPPLEERRTV